MHRLRDSQTTVFFHQGCPVCGRRLEIDVALLGAQGLLPALRRRLRRPGRGARAGRPGPAGHRGRRRPPGAGVGPAPDHRGRWGRRGL